MDGVAAVTFPVPQVVAGIADRRVARGGPAETVVGLDRLAAEFDRGIHRETGGLHIGDLVQADLRQHRFGVFPAPDAITGHFQIKGQRALLFPDVGDADAAVQQVGQPRWRVALRAERGAAVRFAEQALVDASAAAEKRIVGAVGVEVIRRSGVVFASKVHCRDEHAFDIRPHTHGGVLIVDVFHMIHVVRMAAGDEVAHRLVALRIDVPRMQGVGPGFFQNRMIRLPDESVMIEAAEGIRRGTIGQHGGGAADAIVETADPINVRRSQAVAKLMGEHTAGRVVDLHLGIRPHRLAPLHRGPVEDPRVELLCLVALITRAHLAGADLAGAVGIGPAVFVEIPQAVAHFLPRRGGPLGEVVVADDIRLAPAVVLFREAQRVAVHFLDALGPFFGTLPAERILPVIILAVITVEMRILIDCRHVRHHLDFRPGDAVAVDLEIFLLGHAGGMAA